MFKSARWRSDKNKVKAVFKLQFHAAQLPQVGGDPLIVSVVPADTGKPSVKSDKAVVRDGSCFWENPVYETVKFNREPKSGKIHEKIYYLVVGTGQSKAGIVGEASIDFSSYAEATKVSLVSLPLEKSQSEAALNVSIQRVQESNDQRDVEESENAKLNSKDHSLRAQFGNGDVDGAIKSNSVEDLQFNKAVSQISELNGNHRASSESDVTMSSSESSSGIETPWESQVKNHNIDQRPGESLSLRSQGPKSNAPTAIYEEHQGSQWEWLGNSVVEASTDDSLSTPRETFVRQHSEMASDIVIENLKSEVTALSRQAEMSELELQTLRKQIIKESKKGQDLLREIVCLKEEKDALKEECEKLKAFQKRCDEVKTKTYLHFEEGDSQALVQELRQELNHAKELNANLQIQLQKTQESNSELILAVRDLDEMLEQKNQEISNLSNKSLALVDMDKKSREVDSTCETDDEEQKALEELVKEHSGAKEAYLLEQQMMDLRGEIEIYRRDKDELEMQMEQLALDYEIMKQENHDMSYRLEQSQLQEQLKIQYECSSSYATAHELESQIENLENELKIRSKEFTDSLLTISELETHTQSLEEELEKQAHGFEADLEALMCSKVEQEQRAIRAEEALRKTRWQNANTAERLQEEFRRLSSQMASTFEANEKLATKALAEANELRIQKIHLEEMLQNTSEELQSMKDHYEARLHQFSSQTALMSNQIGEMQSEIKEREVQLGQQKMQAKETQKLLSEEILMLKDELEQMKKSAKEMELHVEQQKNERAKLETSFLLVKNEAEEWQKDIIKMRCVLEEKEEIVRNLQSELDSLQSYYDELKHSLSEDKSEKEKLRKQVLQLKSDLKKSEDALSSMEKKIKDSSARGTTFDSAKATFKTVKSMPLPRGNKEIANLKERIKLLEVQIMLKETALESSSNSFLEREKDLHNKIEELEEKLEVLNQSSAHFFENEVKKAAPAEEDEVPNCTLHEEESRNSGENLSTMIKTSNITNCVMSSTKGDGINLSEVLKDSMNNIGDDENINEIALLKERNKSMEEELKEMQGRYSEISLKFAEVEGERQQLVMKLRNLKNARKSS